MINRKKRRGYLLQTPSFFSADWIGVMLSGGKEKGEHGLQSKGGSCDEIYKDAGNRQ